MSKFETLNHFESDPTTAAGDGAQYANDDELYGDGDRSESLRAESSNGTGTSYSSFLFPRNEYVKILDACQSARDLDWVRQAYDWLQVWGFLKKSPSILSPKKCSLCGNPFLQLVAGIVLFPYLVNNNLDSWPLAIVIVVLGLLDSIYVEGADLAQILSFWPGCMQRRLVYEAGLVIVGPSQFTNPETLRSTHVIQSPQRGSSVRTNAGRNKKWRTLDKGRLEGNKRTRSNGNAGKPKPPQRPDGSFQAPPQNGFRADGTERPVKEPREKPKKGPKPKERVTFAGQKMLLLDRSKVGADVQPWASVRTERMPDDYYKYGPFGPHAWKGVTVGSPRKGTLCDNLVVFFSSVENEEEHELGDIQDAITSYAQRVDQMDDESVGVQYYFAFARQVVKVPGLAPWEEWTLVAQLAVESGAELDKERLGSQLDRKMWEILPRCVAWYRPDLIYVKRPAFHMRFEPQKEFLEGLATLLDPEKGSQSFHQTLCSLLGVDENENAEQVATVFDGFSPERKMECVAHVLSSHPISILPRQDLKAKQQQQQQKSAIGMSNGSTDDEIESIEAADEEGDDSSVDDTSEDEPEEDFEAFNGEFREEFGFDEQDLGDIHSTGNEWEIEEAKALAAEAIQNSATAQSLDADEEALKAYSEFSKSSTNGQPVIDETEAEEREPCLHAAVRPFSYTNLIKEIFIIRSALVEMAEFER